MSPRTRRSLPEDGAALTNAHIAATLSEIADLLDIKGESSFKVSAYRRAADSVAHAAVDVAAAYRLGQAPRLRGVGSTISDRIGELVRSGRVAYLDDLRSEVPPSLLSLLAVPGIGPRTCGEVWRTLGIATLPELETAARAGRLRAIRGISARSEARIAHAIQEFERRPPRRMRMGEAHGLADRLVALIEALPHVERVIAAGSVRRWCETVGDLDILVATSRPAAVIAAVGELTVVAAVESGGGGHDRATYRLLDGPGLDIMTMPPAASGSYLVHFTGSSEHNVLLRHRAREMGWSLSERGLAAPDDEGTPSLTFASEDELYRQLGLDAIPPELREGRGEIEAAAAGTLPRLVERADLRGDCHSHSLWSDGREALDVMAESARSDGREYQVLTDHSHSLTIANGLSPQRVEEQHRVIGELNERFAREAAAGKLPDGAHPAFRLLHGTELEITPEGRLDYDDEVLAGLDVVVASLHVGRRQPRARLMARYEVAMRSPHVDIISHPSGRRIGEREGLDLDWEAFYRMAAESGTLLEINGSEARLDLDEDHVRAAASAGCRFVISSDAHARSEWRHLDYGTAIARRGWLPAESVANTLPLDAFLALMAEKPHRF